MLISDGFFNLHWVCDYLGLLISNKLDYLDQNFNYLKFLVDYLHQMFDYVELSWIANKDLVISSGFSLTYLAICIGYLIIWSCLSPTEYLIIWSCLFPTDWIICIKNLIIKICLSVTDLFICFDCCNIWNWFFTIDCISCTKYFVTWSCWFPMDWNSVINSY